MKRTPRKPSVSGFSVDRESLAEWAKDKPLSILQLDPADRAVLRIAVHKPIVCCPYSHCALLHDCSIPPLDFWSTQFSNRGLVPCMGVAVSASSASQRTFVLGHIAQMSVY
uniref:Uncharacterized protein n=1 Tax=Anopheles merus TaxID=30066 RepID=A0A182V7J2_ANOME